MSKKKYENIDKFLEEVEIDRVPAEFISSACITELNGNEYYVSFEEVADIFNNGPLEDQGIKAVKAVINMDAVRQTIYEMSNEVMRSTKL